jgi:hypothetical protein
LILLAWMGPARLAAAQRVDLVDEVYRAPAHEWRYLEFGLRQLPVTLECDYGGVAGSDRVRLLLIRKQGPRRLRPNHLLAPVAMTERGSAGRLQYHVRFAGDYALVIDNRDGDVEAPVRLRVSLNFGPVVTYLSPQRRLAVILASFGVFFGIVAWSARRLISAFR